jgi:Type II secretion system (T2SS), protein G
VEQLTREHKPQAIAAGMWIGLWAGEVLMSAEYWLARGASFAFSTLRAYLRRPFLYGSVALVAAAASFGSVTWDAQERGGQTRTARLDTAGLMNGVDLYKMETGHFPARLEDLVPKYVRELHLDPWGKPYAFYQGSGGAAVVSAGPDGKLGTGDDILIERGNK